MFKWFKNLFGKVNDVREKIEDVMANILDKVQENEAIDEVEKKLIAKGIQAGIIYFTGTCALTDKQLANIAEPIVESGINKINPPLSKQLKKKSKLYKERHNED